MAQSGRTIHVYHYPSIHFFQTSLYNHFGSIYSTTELHNSTSSLNMKGKFKRRRAGGQFRTGNKLSSTYRLSSTTASACMDQVDYPSCSPSLRPRPDLQERSENGSLGNRVINLDRMILTINSIYSEHDANLCGQLRISLDSEQKYGLGSRLTFKCDSCGHIFKQQETYKKCPGSSAAAINMMLASALQDTAIGIEKVRLLLTSMDIPPVSRSHMQTLVNKSCVNTVKLNDEDMAEKRQLVIEHNMQQGNTNPRHLDLSFDGRYNANRMVSSYKPGQAASQAYGVAIENNTSYKYVVGLAVQNKLCWTGAYLRNKGFDDIKCPGGHEGCTATKDYMQPHSEREMAADIAEQLSKEDILVRTLTTDGDTRAHLGMSDFYDKLGSAWSVNRQADPHHLGSRQVRKAKSSSWSVTLFGGKKLTSTARQEATTAFARDIKARSSGIIEKLRVAGDGDLTKEVHRLPEIRAATIECYAGNCSFCPHNSLVCGGLGGEGDWWYSSKYLPTHGIHHLKMTENDRELLSGILEIRLSEAAVLSVSSNTSTQKCEAYNRAVLSVAPKDVNMGRNFAGSLASKTLQLNNTLEDSVTKKVRSITGNSLSPKSRRYLRSSSKRSASHKQYQKTAAFKAKRRNRRAKLENVYYLTRSGSTGMPDEYMKGQLDEAGPST